MPSLHLAVAPAGSALPAATVGADAALGFAAVVAAGDEVEAAPAGGDVAGGADAPPGAAGVSGAAGTAALVEELAFGAFTWPPCPLQAPRPVADDVVPSLQVVEPPVAAGDEVEAEPAGGDVAGGADAPPGAAGVSGAAGTAALVDELAFGAFTWPPCPLQAPRPVADDVVPSLQVVAPPVAAGDDVEAEPAGGDVAGGADAPPGAAGVSGAAGTAALVDELAFGAFTWPPCPLQAPRPVAVDVVPSLQVVAGVVVAAVSSA